MAYVKRSNKFRYIRWTTHINSATLFIQAEVAALVGDILCVELPEIGEILKKGDLFGSIQGVTDSFFLKIPFAGKITAVNSRLECQPDLLRSPTLDEGWLVSMTVKDP